VSSPTIIIEVNNDSLKRKHSLQAINKYKRDKLNSKSVSQRSNKSCHLINPYNDSIPTNLNQASS